MLYKVTLTAKRVHDCPLYNEGDKMVMSFPRIDKALSDEICALTLSEFLPYLYKKFRGLGAHGDHMEFKVCHGCELQGAWVGFTVSSQPAEQNKEESQRIRNTTARLKKISLFERIPNVGLLTLAEMTEEITYAEGDIILKEGEQGDGLYAVQEGLCLVYQGNGETHIAEIGPGDCFGEMSILTDQPTSATIKAAEETVVYKVAKADVFRLTSSYPALANYFSKLLAERLKRTNSAMVEKLASGFSGTLAHMSPAELIQAIDAADKGGKLTVKGVRHSLELEFQSGLIYGIEGTFTDDASENFYDFLNWKEGSFTFSPCAVETAGRHPFDPTALLINGLRMQDEQRVGYGG